MQKPFGIYDLKRIYEDRPAFVREIAGVIHVEPGDATHYEVFCPCGPGGDFASAEVGHAGDNYCGVVVRNLHGLVDVFPFGRRSGGPGEYNLEVLTYLAKLALRVHGDEPEEWKRRRERLAQNNKEE